MIKRIEKEISEIDVFAKSIIQDKNMSSGFVSELLQVVKKNLFRLQYMKELINSEEKKNICDLAVELHEEVYIRSKTDEDWIKVRDASLLEEGQIFTTADGKRIGREYKLLSCRYKGDVAFFLDVEIIKG